MENLSISNILISMLPNNKDYAVTSNEIHDFLISKNIPINRKIINSGLKYLFEVSSPVDKIITRENNKKVIKYWYNTKKIVNISLSWEHAMLILNSLGIITEIEKSLKMNKLENTEKLPANIKLN